MRLLLMLLGTIVLLYSPCYATEAVDVGYDVNERAIVISGKPSGTEFNGIVSIAIYKSGASDIVYASYVETEMDGTIHYAFRMAEDIDSGEYLLKLGTYGGATPILKEFTYIDEVARTEALESVNAAADRDGLAAILTSKAGNLGLTKSISINLSTQGMNSLYDALLLKPEFDSISSLCDAYYSEYALIAIKESAPGNIAAILNDFAEFFKFSEEYCYSRYLELGTSAAVADALLVGGNFTDMTAIRTAFNENVILAAIQTAQSWGEIDTVINEYRALIPFSLEIYDKSDKYMMAMALSGKLYKDMDELKGGILAEYNRQVGSKTGGSSGGSSGSGSGGSSGGAGFGAVKDSMQTDNEIVAVPDKYTTIPDWAKTAVKHLHESGIVSGDGDGNFRPNDNITREEFVKLLLLGLGIHEDTAESDFDDVPVEHWAYRYISRAKQLKVAVGNGNNAFGLNEQITREDMAVMAVNALKASGRLLPAIDESVDFTDVSQISDYAVDSIGVLHGAGIINGYGDGNFGPKDSAKRVEAFKIIYMLIGGMSG